MTMKVFSIFLITLSILTQLSAGELELDIDSKIIGGTTAAKGQFPWHVAILLPITSSSRPPLKCNGNIVGKQWILTTANCLYGLDNVTVFAGTLSLSGNEGIRISSEKIILHPDYKSFSEMDNNIGLVKLAQPLPLSDTIQVIEISKEPLREGVQVIVSGWGSRNDQSSPFGNDLKFASLETISNAECSRIFKQTISDSNICATSRGFGLKGICHGDEGSGLVTQPSNKPSLVGIGNFISKHGCHAGQPSGFTRTNFYRDWIKSHTSVSSKLTYSLGLLIISLLFVM